MFGYFDYEKELEYMRQEEREEGEMIGTLRTLASLVKDGILTEDAAAKRANLSVAEFRKEATLA